MLSLDEVADATPAADDITAEELTADTEAWSWEESQGSVDLHSAPPSGRLDATNHLDRPFRSRHGGQPHKSQTEFWTTALLHHDTVVHKLRAANFAHLADRIADCHSIPSMAVCRKCTKAKVFWNRCENWFCPICQPRLTRERLESIEWWTHHVKQPKHVVLTIRNTTTINPGLVQFIKDSFGRLRRSKFATRTTTFTDKDPASPMFGKTSTSHPWRGGFWSMEVTNERRGWHLHIHALIDSPFICQQALKRAWTHLVGQDFAIAKVIDCRGKDYLAEVAKYVVKGSDLAKWEAQDLGAMVFAFDGVRTFGAFGSLYKLRAEWRKAMDDILDDVHVCECGCSDWKVMSPDEYDVWLSERGPPTGRPPPPPQPAPELQF